MTSKNKESAEEKLMKMIEASAGASDASRKEEHKKIQHQQSVVSTIKKINVLLFVGLICALGWVGYEINNGLGISKKSFSVPIEMNKNKNPGASESIVQKISYYLAGVNERNIFKPFEKKEVPIGENVSSENMTIARKTKSLRLVGVSWLSTVESASVMIEDQEKQMTYFLRRGEKIGDITVKTIYADSVQLGYENEEIIIKYDTSQL